ncbi:MAG: response regulator transcription factor [Tepidisphaeraceae bacterium]|jgi:DNA-binding NarL/FixJ family response regulator
MAIRILLADDHRLVREGIRLMIGQQPDMEVVGEADNGRSTVELAKKLSPEIVLIDISMPDLNGIDATHQITALSPAPRVIALSAHTDQRAVVDVLRAGASGYVVKNATAEELIQAIRMVAQAKVYLSPQIAGSVLEDFRRCMPASGSPEFASLSPREREVLQLMAEGKSTKQIAAVLNLSKKTVDNHREHLMSKLNASTLAELIKYAIREGLTSVDNT